VLGRPSENIYRAAVPKRRTLIAAQDAYEHNAYCNGCKYGELLPLGSENDLSGNRHQKTLRGAATPDVARKGERAIVICFLRKTG
jgi:hypothetical protein